MSCFLLKHNDVKMYDRKSKLRFRPVLASHVNIKQDEHNPRSNCHVYLRGLLDGKTGRGGLGGLSGRPASLSASVGVSELKAKPPEALLPVEVFLRCVRSERLEEQECSVL